MADHGMKGIVKATNGAVRVEAHCISPSSDKPCRFASRMGRGLTNMDVRLMARIHAGRNPGHIVQITTTAIAIYACEEK